MLVALTGFGQEQDKEQAIRAGFDAHLTKPADGTALAAIVAHSASRANATKARPSNNLVCESSLGHATEQLTVTSEQSVNIDFLPNTGQQQA